MSSPARKSTYAGSMQSSALVYSKPRQVTVNIPLPSDQIHSQVGGSKAQYKPLQTYPNNRIRTSKYTLLTFLPKNLFEQFRRVANSFFLLLVVLQAFPLFMSVPVYIAAFPIVFIVLVTAGKDAFEDYKRWVVDKTVNNRNIKGMPVVWRNYNHQESTASASWFERKLKPQSLQVLLEGQPEVTWAQKLWKDIQVGDIVCLENDDNIPADIVILSSSEPDCIAYIETKNLDGETNLKLRQGPVETSWINTPQHCFSKLKCVLESESPTTNMLRYQGTLTLYPRDMAMTDIQATLEKGNKARTELLSSVGSTTVPSSGVKRIPIDINGIVLRGTILRNTRWLIGLVVFTGDDTRQIMNSGKTPSKRSKVEKLMNPHVSLNLFFMLALCLFCAFGHGIWAQQFPNLGDNVPFLSGIVGQPVLDGFVNFWSCLILFQNIVPISLYISVEIVKTIGAFFIYSDLDMYYSVSDTACNPRSWNLADNLGQIEYIFSDKTGTLTRNIMAFKKVCIDGVVYDGKSIRVSDQSQLNLTINTRPLGAGHGKRLSTSQLSFKSAWIEGVRESQGQREANKSMRNLSPTMTHSRNASQASYQSQGSAKDHTEVNMNVQEQEETSMAWVDEAIEAQLTLPEFISSMHSFIIKDFFTLLSVCHTVLVDDQKDKSARPDTPHFGTGNTIDKPKTLQYKAQSPDEACLVTTAAENGFIFKGREHNQATQQNEVIVESLGKEERYSLLNILEFDSDRKRMSVVVRQVVKGSESTSQDVIIFCKGADSIIFERLAPGQQETMSRTSKHLEDFAQDGLRTLCLAYRKVPGEFYNQWAERYHLVQTQVFPDPSQRAKQLELLNNEIECKLVLLGATAIEDKLQDGVPQCIQTLAHAGIKIWVLTGDKIETAINVGFLCGLLKTTETVQDFTEVHKSGMILIEVKNANSDDEIQRQLTSANQRFWGSHSKQSRNEFALIIDGQSLKYALENDNMKDLLLDIGCKCKAVICCRVSPLQKAKVVELVKRGRNVMTLAIGDGANDVSMIQAADVGVGISGEEGLQAAMSADYSIAQFRYLQKLLLVHGRWSYSRISYMILNFYLKSIVFTMVVFWFQFYCGFSASVIYEFTYMLFYNLLFTSLPIVFLGIFDQDLSRDVLNAVPPVYYSEGIKQTFYTQQKFVLYLIESVWHSLICYFVPVMIYGEGPSNSSGLTISSNHLGTVIAIGAIVTVNMSVILDNHSFTILSHIIMWGSCALILIYTLVYGYFPGSPVLGISPELFPDIQFWLSVVIVIAICLGPRFTYYFMRRSLFPCDSDILSEMQSLIKHGRMKLIEIMWQPPTASNSVENSRRESAVSPASQHNRPAVQQYDDYLQVPGLTRRPSQASLASVTYNMSTGDSAKVMGFSFSHTLGMGAVLLRSPLNMLPFKNSPNIGSRSSSSAGPSGKPRVSWPHLRSNSSSNFSKTPASAAPNTDTVVEEEPSQDVSVPVSKISFFGRKMSGAIASLPVVRSPLSRVAMNASPSSGELQYSSSSSNPGSAQHSQRLPSSNLTTPGTTQRFQTVQVPEESPSEDSNTKEVEKPADKDVEEQQK